MPTLNLNLGASDDRREGFLSVDRCAPADVVADLRLPWPWKDSTVDAIYAKDVLEHLYAVCDADFLVARTDISPKAWVMNEAWRVLKPGGMLELLVPCVYLGDGRVNPGAFADPTHVSYWTMDDIYYYDQRWNNMQGERGRLGPSYGITALFRTHRWELQEYGAPRERRSKIHGVLEAIK